MSNIVSASVDYSGFIKSMNKFSELTRTNMRFVFRWQLALWMKDGIKHVFQFGKAKSLPQQKKQQERTILRDISKVFVPIPNSAKVKFGKSRVTIDEARSGKDGSYQFPLYLWWGNGAGSMSAAHFANRDIRGRVRTKRGSGSFGPSKSGKMFYYASALHVRVNERKAYLKKTLEKVGKSKAALFHAAQYFSQLTGGSVKNIAPSWVTRHAGKMKQLAVARENNPLMKSNYYVEGGTSAWWLARDTHALKVGIAKRERDLQTYAIKRIEDVKRKVGFT